MIDDKRYQPPTYTLTQEEVSQYCDDFLNTDDQVRLTNIVSILQTSTNITNNLSKEKEVAMLEKYERYKRGEFDIPPDVPEIVIAQELRTVVEQLVTIVDIIKARPNTAHLFNHTKSLWQLLFRDVSSGLIDLVLLIDRAIYLGEDIEEEYLDTILDNLKRYLTLAEYEHCISLKRKEK